MPSKKKAAASGMSAPVQEYPASDEDVFVASTQRASRAARSPPPTQEAQIAAWQESAQLAAELEKRGLERINRLPPTTFQPRMSGGHGRVPARAGRSSGGGGSGSTAIQKANGGGDEEPALDAGKPASPTAQLSHVFSLQRPIDANVREASFLTYQSVLPLEATQLAANGMRSNSVRVSLVYKPKKTCGGGQQTTRNNLGDLSAAWASQSASVAIALGAARRVCLDAHGIQTEDPTATIAINTASLVDEDKSHRDVDWERIFVVTSTARLLPHALPTRVAQHSFLSSMCEFARSELEMGSIRQRVPQQVDALRSVCNAVIDNTEGTSVWAAWVLLCHMLSDPRLRRMVQLSPISDMDAATAALFQGYARGEITRRARIPEAPEEEPREEEPRQEEPEEEPEEEDAESAPPAASERLDNSTVDPLADANEFREGIKWGVDMASIPGVDLDYVANAAAQGAKGGDCNPKWAKGVEKAFEKLGKLKPKEEQPLTTVQDEIARRQEADKATLSLKRKRPPTAGASVPPSSAGFLDYWQAALGSEFASILKTMITQSKSAAEGAALETLCGQTPQGTRAHFNPLLVDISSRNAIKSAEAISSLVVTPETRVPKILVWRARNHENHIKLHAGIIRSPSDASNTTIHACSLAPSYLQPSKGTRNHTVAIWSLAIRNTTPRDSTTSLLPGVVEGAVHLHALQAGKVALRNKHHLSRVFETVKSRAARGASDGSLDTTLTGIARGVIVLRAKLCVSASQVHVGTSIAKDLSDAHAEAVRRAGFTPQNDYESCALLSEESLDGKRLQEPYATPASNLALALQANEQLRVLMKGRSHRGDPCRHLCGVTTSTEMSEASVDQYDLPQALLPIVDCKVDFLENPRGPEGAALPNRRDSMLRKVAITLTVCGDAPVRVTDLIDAYCDDVVDRPFQGIDAQGFFEAMALTHAAAARASEVNDLACSVCAGQVNSCIASAKRILVGDLNTRLYLTLYQVWRVGTANVPRQFETTPWSGCYSAGFDIGTSGGIGIRASSVTADKRNHGKILMGQEQVDDWCADLAHTHYVKVDRCRYAAIPRECRGVPHQTIPGVHAYLDDYETALERSRELLGVQGHATVDSLQALSFGPYAERLAPYVSEQADPTTCKSFRNPDDKTHADGRAFQADATCPDLGIFREPLVPSVAITAPQDNIFAQAQPFLASVFGAAAAIARHARTAYRLGQSDDAPRPREEVAFLHRQLASFHSGEPMDHVNHYLSASVMVLLNVLFPASHAMAGAVVREAYARAPALCAAAIRAKDDKGFAVHGRTGPTLPELFADRPDVLEEAQAFWAPFVRPNVSTNAWARLEPLLLALLEADGSYDNGVETLDALWRANDTLLRAAAWYVASPDGQHAPSYPSPLAGVRSWTQVRSDHLVPIFVGSVHPVTNKHMPARSSLVGCMPMGYQQILHLLMGSANDPRVIVQYAHNYGSLIYRPSAAPDILTSKNRERSSKAISVVNVEGDDAAFGTRVEKLKVCKLQRAAWTTNLDLVKPLCTRIAPPLPDARRARGDRGAVDFIKQQKRDLDAAGVHTKQEHEAAALFHQAVLDSIPRAAQN